MAVAAAAGACGRCGAARDARTQAHLEMGMTEPTDFTAILAHWEAQQPDAIAISFGGTNRTWGPLADRVRRNAAAQRAAGLQPGDRIAVLDLNHPSCLELTLACAQVGTANAVVNFRLAPPEIVYVV
jgi:acyl-CoA synthetase (AMP-forming)/AMP-acid ligase II